MPKLPFRYWRLRWQSAVVVGVPVALGLLATALAVVVQDESLAATAKAAAPVAAVVVALISVVVAASGVIANYRRSRREATIKAWTDWSDATIEDRRTMTRYFGLGALNRETGFDIVKMGPQGLHGRAPETLRPDELKNAKERATATGAMVRVLNGLERLAVGVEVGVYDFATLNRLGGTIVVRHFERSQTYIEARRTAEDDQLRQANAFTSLQYVAGLLDHQHQRAIDKARLAALRRK
jgi:hypothetical protein